MGPDAGIAVCLQLETHRQAFCAIPFTAKRRVHACARPEKILDMMTDLVRDHVRLRKIAGRPESPRELLIKTQIDVYAFVLRAIERTCRRGAVSTSGWRA